MDLRKNTRSRKADRSKSKVQCRELYQDAIECSYFIAKLDVSENDIARLQEVFVTVQKTFGMLRCIFATSHLTKILVEIKDIFQTRSDLSVLSTDKIELQIGI